MNRSRVLLTLTALFLLLAPAGTSRAATAGAASNWLGGWPMQGHDPQHTFRSPVTGPTELHLLFSRVNTMVRAVGADGRLYTVTDVLTARGRPLWKFKNCCVTDPPVLQPNGDLTYVGGRNARDVNDLIKVGRGGRTLWSIRPYGLSKGSIMVGASNGTVYSPVIGPPPNAMPWPSPYTGTNIVSRSGRLVRRLTAVLAAPVLARGGRLYGVGGPDFRPPRLYAFTPGGCIAWSVPWPTPLSSTAGPMLGGGGRLYLGADASLLSFSSSGRQLWQVKKPDQVLALAEGADGAILALGQETLDAFSQSGTHLWSVALDYHSSGFPSNRPSLIADGAGTAYAGTGDGAIHVISAAGKVLARITVGTRYHLPPALFLAPDGHLIVDGSDGTMRVYG